MKAFDSYMKLVQYKSKHNYIIKASPIEIKDFIFDNLNKSLYLNGADLCGLDFSLDNLENLMRVRNSRYILASTFQSSYFGKGVYDKNTSFPPGCSISNPCFQEMQEQLLLF